MGMAARPLQSGLGTPPVQGVSSEVLRIPPMMGLVGEYFGVSMCGVDGATAAGSGG